MPPPRSRTSVNGPVVVLIDEEGIVGDCALLKFNRGIL